MIVVTATARSGLQAVCRVIGVTRNSFGWDLKGSGEIYA
jgi:hypothetical protein